MKHLYFCLLLLAAFFAVGQNADTTTEDIILPVKQYPYLKIDAGFGALCNSLSTSELTGFVSDDFLDDDEKSELLNSIPSSLRYGYFRNISASYIEPGYAIFDVYKKGWGIGLRNTYYNSARISKDMLNLIFYGNKPYAGTTVNPGKSNTETWYFSSIDYHFDLLVDTLLPVYITTSIHTGHFHNDYNVKMAEIYTEPIGEYLDMNLNYSTKNTSSTAPIAGMGLTVGAEIDLPVKDKGMLKLSVQDFGAMYWTNGEVLDVDSSFRFQGVYFDNLFDLNDSIRNSASEEYKNSFYYSDSKNYTRLMPFRLAASYRHKMDKQPWLNEIIAEANYRYLPGYFPQLRLGANIKTGHKQYLLAMLSAGGYTWAGLDLAYHLEVGYDWKVDIAIHNLNGLVIPVMSGGAYATLGVTYRL